MVNAEQQDWQWTRVEGHYHDDVAFDLIAGKLKIAEIQKQEKETGKVDVQGRRAVMDWLEVVFSDRVVDEVRLHGNRQLKEDVRNLERLWQRLTGTGSHYASDLLTSVDNALRDAQRRGISDPTQLAETAKLVIKRSKAKKIRVSAPQRFAAREYNQCLRRNDITRPDESPDVARNFWRKIFPRLSGRYGKDHPDLKGCFVGGSPQSRQVARYAFRKRVRMYASRIRVKGTVK